MNIIRKPFRYRNYGVVYWLIGINVLIFAATQFLGPQVNYLMTVYLTMIPAIILEKGWVWTFVTYMFMHGGVTHILFNMFGLFIFGTQVERQMGSFEFLLYYLITGILAGIFSFVVYVLSGTTLVVLLGASGAIFAVQLAYAVFFPNSIIYLWGILPLRAPVMVLGFTALELIFSITGTRSNVAHLTHLAGFGFGWLYFLARLGVNPWRRLSRR
jgi:membrane associated rhomboid family serine protease